MPPPFQINDTEWSLLVEEPAEVFKLYCVLRRVMDFATGIAGGEKRRINEQALREALYVAPIRGRHESGSPTRQKVRSLIDRLVVLGALQPIGPLVFQLPLATRDSPAKGSATNQQPDQQPDQQPMSNRAKAANNGASSESEDQTATALGSDETGNSNLPPVSDKSKEQPPLPPRGGTPRKRSPKVALPDPFVLTVDMARWAKERTPLVSLRNQTERFVNHFRAKGETKADWVAAWRNWLLREQDDLERRQPGRAVPASAGPDFENTDWVTELEGTL